MNLDGTECVRYTAHTNPERSEHVKYRDKDRQEAAAELRKLLKPGTTVYTVLRHVSSSGMSRRIDLFVIKGGRLVFLSGYAGRLLGLHRRGRHDGLVVGGCGMDMGFHLVYELGAALWPKGTRTPHGIRNGQPDTDGGYALKHSWI